MPEARPGGTRRRIQQAAGPREGIRERSTVRGFAALLALGLLVGCSSSADEGMHDVILITVDTLRADHLGLYGYERDTTPNLTRRFANGEVFLRSYSAESSTSPSVVSILTGRLPQQHGVRMLYQILPSEIEIVTDLLPEAYQTAAFVSNIVLTDEALGIASRFDHYDDFVDEKEPRRAVYERGARRTSEAVIAWLESELDPSRPLFLWVHYIDPHGPYQPPAEYAGRFRSEKAVRINNLRVPGYTRVPGVTDGNDYVDRYDDEIAYADAQIERVFAAYSRRRDLDRALVIFTADHGESMMDHEKWFTHSYHVYDEIVHVPLMLRGPGVRASRIEMPTSGIDIVPTILAFVGSEQPPSLTGVDLRHPEDLVPDRIVYTEATQPRYEWRAAVRGAYKWMMRVDSRKNKPQYHCVYDLASDPGELRPRRWKAVEPPEEFLDLVQSDPDPGGIPAEYRGGVHLDAPKVRPGLGEEALEKLRALGYAGLENEEDADQE